MAGQRREGLGTDSHWAVFCGTGQPEEAASCASQVGPGVIHSCLCDVLNCWVEALKRVTTAISLISLLDFPAPLGIHSTTHSPMGTLGLREVKGYVWGHPALCVCVCTVYRSVNFTNTQIHVTTTTTIRMWNGCHHTKKTSSSYLLWPHSIPISHPWSVFHHYIFFFSKCHVNRIMQYVTFWCDLLSLNFLSFGFIQVVTCINPLFLVVAE